MAIVVRMPFVKNTEKTQFLSVNHMLTFTKYKLNTDFHLSVLHSFNQVN